jgi:hypothetical protein
MKASQAIDQIFTEELGALADVPPGWIKLLTRAGAGDKSEVVPIKRGLSGPRDLSATMKTLTSGQFAGLYLTKSDGSPIGIISYNPENQSKPWRFVTPSGDSVTQTDYKTRAKKRWQIRPRSYVDAAGKTQTFTPRGERETVSVKRSEVSLNELSGMIPFQDGVDLFGVKVDTARRELQAQRATARSGKDSDITDLKKGVAQKFVAGKIGSTVDSLKAQIQAVTDEVRQRLDAAIASASSGEYLSRRGSDGAILSPEKVEELNAMLYDLASISRRAKEAPEKGLRSGYRRRMRHDPANPNATTNRSYEFDDLMSDLERVKGRLAKISSDGGRYEQKATELVNQLFA